MNQKKVLNSFGKKLNLRNKTLNLVKDLEKLK